MTVHQSDRALSDPAEVRLMTLSSFVSNKMCLLNVFDVLNLK